MDLHHYGIIIALVGFLISLVWIVLDNKNFMKNLTNSGMGGIIKRKKSQGG